MRHFVSLPTEAYIDVPAEIGNETPCAAEGLWETSKHLKRKGLQRIRRCLKSCIKASWLLASNCFLPIYHQARCFHYYRLVDYVRVASAWQSPGNGHSVRVIIYPVPGHVQSHTSLAVARKLLHPGQTAFIWKTQAGNLQTQTEKKCQQRDNLQTMTPCIYFKVDLLASHLSMKRSKVSSTYLEHNYYEGEFKSVTLYSWVCFILFLPRERYGVIKFWLAFRLQKLAEGNNFLCKKSGNENL